MTCLRIGLALAIAASILGPGASADFGWSQPCRPVIHIPGELVIEHSWNPWLGCNVNELELVLVVGHLVLESNGTLVVPDAISGADIVHQCAQSAIGKPGLDGASLTIRATRVELLGVVHIASGGHGGNASVNGCGQIDAVAFGGPGGDSGAFHLDALVVEDLGRRTGGVGGNGGNAIAMQRAPGDNESEGANGSDFVDPNGEDATAVAANGTGVGPDGSSGKNASATGGYGGRGATTGGRGGNAFAQAGLGQKGLDATATERAGSGGTGGCGNAHGGHGGTGPRGGSGGDAVAYSGDGGDGGPFLEKNPLQLGAGSGGPACGANAVGGMGELGPIVGGHGGNASSISGRGGDGGDDHRRRGVAGSGSSGGQSKAVGGAGGESVGGNGGNGGSATAISGRGGDGGDGSHAGGLASPASNATAEGGAGGFGLNGGAGGSAGAARGRDGMMGGLVPAIDPLPLNTTTASITPEDRKDSPGLAGATVLLALLLATFSISRRRPPSR